MAAPSVTYTFVNATTIQASEHNTNFSDLVTYLTNRNSGATAWDGLTVSGASALTYGSGVPLTVNNSTGANDILRVQDNGSNVLVVGDGGSVAVTPTSATAVPLTLTAANGGSQKTLVINNGTSTGNIFEAQDNGTSMLTVADGGIVTTANQSGCRVTRASSTQAISANTNTKVQFNSEDYDVKSEFDSATNYRFTATAAGKYLIMSTIYLTCSAGSSGIGWVKIYKNGAGYSQGFQAELVDSDIGSISHADILNLAVGDYVEIFVRGTVAFTINISDGASNTTGSTVLSIAKIA